jgi:antibiotic biosynthesis monooxygenase (ABM) superfamily enzyme
MVKTCTQMIKMYAIIYFNWSGSKEEWEEAKETLNKAASKFDGLELVDILIPSSEWNYAALMKFKNFESFIKYIKKTREEPITFFAKRGLHPPPKKLELLVDLEQLE